MKKKTPPHSIPRPDEHMPPRALAPIHPQALGAAPVLDETPRENQRKLVIGVLAMASLAAAASFALVTTRTATERAAEADWMARAKRMLPAVGDEQHVDGAMRTIQVPGTASPVVDDPAPKINPAKAKQP